MATEVHAPVNEGDQLGTLTISLPDGEEITASIQALNGVVESGAFSRLWDAIALFFLKLLGGDPLAFSS